MTCYSGFEFSRSKAASVFDDGVWQTPHELRRQSDHPGGPCELRRLIADAGVRVGKSSLVMTIILGYPNKRFRGFRVSYLGKARDHEQR